MLVLGLLQFLSLSALKPNQWEDGLAEGQLNLFIVITITSKSILAILQRSLFCIIAIFVTVDLVRIAKAIF